MFGLYFKILNLVLAIVTMTQRYLERKPRKPWVVFTRVLYPDRIGICSVDFCKGRNTGETEEKPSEHDETKPTYGNGPESNPGHIGGRPLCHPCSIAFI